MDVGFFIEQENDFYWVCSHESCQHLKSLKEVIIFKWLIIA